MHLNFILFTIQQFYGRITVFVNTFMLFDTVFYFRYMLYLSWQKNLFFEKSVKYSEKKN